MLRTIVVLCLAALGGSKDLQKRQAGYGAPAGGYGAPAGGYGAPAGGYGAPAGGYGAPAGGYGAPAGGNGAPAGGYGAPPALDASYNAAGYGGGAKCRATTKYVLTWTRTVIPVTAYDTETRYLPTTLYQYVTETETVPTTEVQLVTTTRPAPPGYQEDTRISYRTRTLVVPQVEVVTSTLLLTDDEHVTVTETDHLTQTKVQQYQVEVTSTSVVNVPQIITSVATEYQTQYQTEYATQQHDVVQTKTLNVPQQQYITSTVTQVQYQTVAVTHTQQQYHTVTQCPQQGYQGRY